LQHYAGLETKVVLRLLFNIPLWFSQITTSTSTSGAALHLALLPALSFITKSNPEKVRDCVVAKEMIYLLRELAIGLQQEDHNPPKNSFLLDDKEEEERGKDTLDTTREKACAED
jgi:hypothetical protein